jgi:hypothetical protein
LWSQDSSVSIVIGPWARWPGFKSWQGQDFSLMRNVQSVLGPTQPPIQWVPVALSLGLKRQGREADHTRVSSAEVKNGGAIHPLPHLSSWHST